jgi:beta-mannosidase
VHNLQLITEPDGYGRSFVFKLNGRIVNVKGADFIPLDSIPARMTYDAFYSLLRDVKASNMNGIRLWGWVF